MANNGFTPTQAKMVEVLSDGRPHRREELHACLPDELGAMTNIYAHLTAIRKHLRSKGQDVVSRQVDGISYYHLVVLTPSPYRG